VNNVRLSGYALHSGVITSLELARHDGPITFARGSQRARLSSLRVARTDFGLGLTDGHGFEIDLVEHFLAAIGGLGIGGGILATLDGPELPILDGGARAFVDALMVLEIPPVPRRWIVQKPGNVKWKESVYDFDVMDSVELVVVTEFAHPGIGRQRASWNGDARRFADEIAPARTFGFVNDAEDLWNSSRARLAALASTGDAAATKALTDAVLVYGKNGMVDRNSRPPLPDEQARHKLLDLTGDLALYGGPPRGKIRALRPGHTVTHRIIAEAISLGILSAP